MAETLMSNMRSTKQTRKAPEKMAALKVSFEKKKECEAKALHVVDSLLDNTVTAGELLAKCLEINNSYYDDLVEERAIAGLCGYPCCCNKLKKNTSTQLYHISLRVNKVFDIVQRKRFCSNVCFKASQFLDSQLPTCPVWLINQERPRELKLYQHLDKSLGLGNEVVFEDRSVKEELIQSKLEFENSAEELSKKMDKITIKDSTDTPEKAKRPVNNAKCLSQKKELPVSRLDVIEKSIQQWMTVETLQFLLGPERYQKALASNGIDNDNAKNLTELQEFQEKEALAQKYMELCRKLDLEALADHALDSKLVQDVQEKQETKVLPSYECLAEETKRFSLNVQAFYDGKMEVLKEDAEGNVASSKQSAAVEKLEENSDPKEFSYPLTDNHSQRALRRRIVLDKLNRVNHSVLQMMELSQRDISSELRHLVATFNLQAHNITFRPAEWTLVKLIMLHLLGVKMNGIHLKLQEESSQRCMNTLLQMFSKQVDHFTHLVNSLMDVRNVLKT